MTKAEIFELYQAHRIRLGYKNDHVKSSVTVVVLLDCIEYYSTLETPKVQGFYKSVQDEAIATINKLTK